MTTTTNIPTDRLQRFVTASTDRHIDSALRNEWMGDVQGRKVAPVEPEQVKHVTTQAQPVFGRRG